MRVLLADDHSLLLEGLKNLLEGRGIEVVGTAADGFQAMYEARRLEPDVILMDVRMPNCDGLQATRVIKTQMPETKVIMLTTSSEDEDLFEAVRSGASGYLLKSMSADSLMEALHDVEHDVPPFAPGLAARLLTEFARVSEGSEDDAQSAEECRPAAESRSAAASQTAEECRPAAESQPTAEVALSLPAGLEPLTRRQVEVLALVARGLSYKEVAARVCIATTTVKYHMAEIMQKLHVHNRAQLLTVAARMDLAEDVADA